MVDSRTTEALSCPICLDTLHSPMLLSCCGNTFCAACLHAALSASPYCPLCRAHVSLEQATPNRALGALLPENKVSLCWAIPSSSSQASTRPRISEVDESAPLRGSTTETSHFRGDDAMVQAAWREQCARARCAFYAARASSLQLEYRAVKTDAVDGSLWHMIHTRVS